MPFPLPGDLPDPGIEPESPALQTVYLLSVPLFGKPNWKPNFLYFILIIQKSRKTEERMSFSDHLHCEQLGRQPTLGKLNKLTQLLVEIVFAAILERFLHYIFSSSLTRCF